MVLYVIGLGLSDEYDITLKGLEAVKSSERIYLEAYTSILMVEGYVERLEKLYGKKITMAHRETVELEADDILALSDKAHVSFLVVGDPLSATTHTDLILRARRRSPPTPVQIIHNASITTAIGSSGLQGYNFGQTVSVPFWSNHWKPDSWLPRIRENVDIGCHTLLLGDIKVREQSEQDMARGIVRYQPPRYMLIPQLIDQILSASESHAAADTSLPAVLSADKTLAVSLCRMGSPTESIKAGTLGELLALGRQGLAPDGEGDDEEDELLSEIELDAKRAKRAEEGALAAYGAPLHSLVLVGKRLHHLEMQYAGQYAVEGSKWFEVAKEVYGCVE